MTSCGGCFDVNVGPIDHDRNIPVVWGVPAGIFISRVIHNQIVHIFQLFNLEYYEHIVIY